VDWRAVGVDVGGTKITAARVAGDRVEAVARVPTPLTGADELCEAVAEVVGRVHSTGLPVGVGVAGQVDSRRGVVRSSPNLPVEDLRLADALRGRLGVPVVIDNDVRLAAQGEWLVTGAGPQVLLALYLGTGIGAGAVIGGRPLSGANNVAMEAGHMVFRPGGEPCGCGRRGCFEAYAGGRAIVDRALRDSDQGARRRLAELAGDDPSGVTPATVAAAAAAGHEAALATWSEAEEAIATLAWNLVVLLDPGVVVLGGGVAAGVPSLVSTIRTRLASSAWPELPTAAVQAADPRAPLVGAAWRAASLEER